MPKVGETKPRGIAGIDLAELRESGLSDATIRANKIRSENTSLVFPYCDLDGVYNGFTRWKPHLENKPKYLQPKGSGCRAYFPNASLEKLRDDREPIFITEGEKKALSLSQLGLAVIGLGGVNNGMTDGELIADLRAIDWAGRVVYVVFDADKKTSTRTNVSIAKKKLARVLLDAGAASVRDVLLPLDGEKTGVDDYLVALGSNGPFAFGRLVAEAPDVLDTDNDEAAIPVIKIISISEPEINPDALYGLAGDFVKAVEPYTEASIPCLLGQFLPAAATFIKGPRFGLMEEPAKHFSLIVGTTSRGRKGTGFFMVDRLFRSALPTEFWPAQVHSGLSSGEGVIDALADEEVYDKETKTTDTIPTDKRMLVVEREFSSVLAQAKREGNILSEILRSMFDPGGDVETMTVKKREARGTHVCIIGHITPDELRHALSYVQQINGFANRFLFWISQSDKMISDQRPIPDEVFTPFVKRLKRAYKFFQENVVGTNGRWPVLFTKEAQALWNEVYPTLADDKDGIAGTMVGRRSTLALRVALTFWGLDDPGKKERVTRDHLRASLAVVDYCERSVDALFGDRSGIPLHDRIIDLLKQSPMSKNDLNKHFSVKQKAELPGALETLEARGLIVRRVAKKSGAGRPPNVYAIK